MYKKSRKKAFFRRILKSLSLTFPEKVNILQDCQFRASYPRKLVRIIKGTELTNYSVTNHS